MRQDAQVLISEGSLARRHNLALPRQARRGAGFTLTELLVVIGVIVVLSGMMLPAVKALVRDNGLKQAANQVRATISQARSIAISQHREAGVVFFEETAQYSRPVHGGQTAMQLFVEDFNQSQYAPIGPDNTVFVPFSPARDYLPANVRLAVLNDDASRGVTTGDEAGDTGSTRAVLFDASGTMIARHGLARPKTPTNAAAGSYPRAQHDWNFASPGEGASLGVSSPGVILYDYNEYLAQNIPTDHSGDAARNDWIKQHADVIVLNTNTGGILE